MFRLPNSRTDGGRFDECTIEAVWQKGRPAPAYPGFSLDPCNAYMKRDLYGKTERFGWEIDHIVPVAKGGTDDLANLQPLMWENNRSKGDSFPNWTCKVGA
jgi:hypothetical protein